MKQDHINYFLVGSLVLGMIVLLFFVLLQLTARNGDTDTYFVKYEQIAGLKEGTSVTFDGFQIGQVNRITPDFTANGTRFNLEMQIRAGWKIPKDSIARIVSPGLLSDYQINIAEGTQREFFSPGDTMKGQEAQNLFAALDTVAHEIKDLSDNSVQPLITKLSNRIDTITQRLDSIGGDLDQKVPGIIEKTDRLMDQLNFSAHQLSAVFNDKNQNELTQLLTNTNKMSKNLLDLSQRFDTTIAQLDKMLVNSNQLLENNNKDVRQSVMNLRNALTTVSQNIDSVMYNLDTTSRNFNEFSRKISNNPALLLGSQPAEEGGEASR